MKATILLAALFASATSVLAADEDPLLSLTNDQQEFLMGLEFDEPECLQACSDADYEKYLPLCAHIPSTDDNDIPASEIMNAYSCMCTDRIFLTFQLQCLVEKCAGNKQAIQDMLMQQYVQCHIYAKVDYPKPQSMLKELCLDTKDAPDGFPEFEKTFTYSYQKTIPPLTASTYLTKYIATQTRIPASESAYQEYLKDTRPALTCTNGPKATGTGGAAQQTGSTTRSGTSGPKATGNSTNGNGTGGDDGENSAVGVSVGAGTLLIGLGAGIVGMLAVML